MLLEAATCHRHAPNVEKVRCLSRSLKPQEQTFVQTLGDSGIERVRSIELGRKTVLWRVCHGRFCSQRDFYPQILARVLDPVGEHHTDTIEELVGLFHRNAGGVASFTARQLRTEAVVHMGTVVALISKDLPSTVSER